jgi:hypothetical protein
MGASDDEIGSVQADSERERNNNIEQGSASMRVLVNSIAPLLVAGAAAAAIATAATVVTDHLVPAGNSSRLHGGGWGSGLGLSGFDVIRGLY